MLSNEKKIVAIHQPNFFPWLGYFDKIVKSDIFIFMDNVKFPQTGKGTWINRVKLLINGEPRWTTMSVQRSGGVHRIAEMQIDNRSPWRRKLLATLRMNYAKTRYYKNTFNLIEKIINYPACSVAEYNINAITGICSELGINTGKLMRGSTLNAEGNATALLIAMTKAVDGNIYLCGGGAGGYQEDDMFADAGIGLDYQNFTHPFYEQTVPDFIPGLSILDAMFQCGIEKVSAMLSVNNKWKL